MAGLYDLIQGYRARPEEGITDWRKSWTPNLEDLFRLWYQNVASKGKINQNPDDPLHYYDYRGAFSNKQEQGQDLHFPDTFKTPGHPTFSEESVYAVPPLKWGIWEYPPPPMKPERFVPYEEWIRGKGK
jgi:hypothetical protein